MMTVRQLIETLRSYDQSLPVVGLGGEEGVDHVNTVELVEVVDMTDTAKKVHGLGQFNVADQNTDRSKAKLTLAVYVGS